MAGRFGMDMGNVLKTAELNRKAKQNELDQLNFENEAYGNFIASDNPNALIAATDTNNDGVIDAKEQRASKIKTGMKFGALRDIENLGNKRSTRKRVEANRARATQDRARRESKRLEGVEFTTNWMMNQKDAQGNPMYSEQDMEGFRVLGTRGMQSLIKARDNADKTTKKAIDESIDEAGNIMASTAQYHKANGGNPSATENFYKRARGGASRGAQSLITESTLEKDGRYDLGLQMANLSLLGGVLGDEKPLTTYQKQTKAQSDRTHKEKIDKTVRATSKRFFEDSEETFSAKEKMDITKDAVKEKRANKDITSEEAILKSIEKHQIKEKGKPLGKATKPEGTTGTYADKPIVVKNGQWYYQ